MTRACLLHGPGHSCTWQGTGWRRSAAAAFWRQKAAEAGTAVLLQVGFQPRESSTPLRGACQWFFASSQGCQPPPLSSSCYLCHLKRKPLCFPGTHPPPSCPWVCPCWTFPRDGTPPRVALHVWPLVRPHALEAPPRCGGCQCFLPFMSQSCSGVWLQHVLSAPRRPFKGCRAPGTGLLW